MAMYLDGNVLGSSRPVLQVRKLWRFNPHLPTADKDFALLAPATEAAAAATAMHMASPMRRRLYFAQCFRDDRTGSGGYA